MKTRMLFVCDRCRREKPEEPIYHAAINKLISVYLPDGWVYINKIILCKCCNKELKKNIDNYVRGDKK